MLARVRCIAADLPLTTLEKRHSMTREKLLREPKDEHTQRQESPKQKNLSANAMPADGFVLSVDGKFKTRFENSEEAMAAGVKLKQRYPVIQVAIYDAAARVYAPVELPEQNA
jgi:hypothetical protein